MDQPTAKASYLFLIYAHISVSKGSQRLLTVLLCFMRFLILLESLVQFIQSIGKSTRSFYGVRLVRHLVS